MPSPKVSSSTATNMMKSSSSSSQLSKQNSAGTVSCTESLDEPVVVVGTSTDKDEEERMMEKGLIVSYINKLKKKIASLQKDKKSLKAELTRKDTLERLVVKIKLTEEKNEILWLVKTLKEERDELAWQCEQQSETIAMLEEASNVTRHLEQKDQFTPVGIDDDTDLRIEGKDDDRMPLDIAILQTQVGDDYSQKEESTEELRAENSKLAKAPLQISLTPSETLGGQQEKVRNIIQKLETENAHLHAQLESCQQRNQVLEIDVQHLKVVNQTQAKSIVTLQEAAKQKDENSSVAWQKLSSILEDMDEENGRLAVKCMALEHSVAKLKNNNINDGPQSIDVARHPPPPQHGDESPTISRVLSAAGDRLKNAQFLSPISGGGRRKLLSSSPVKSLSLPKLSSVVHQRKSDFVARLDELRKHRQEAFGASAQ